MKSYRTSDIYFASFLIARGYIMTSTDRDVNKNKNKIFFVIQIDNIECTQLKSQFYSGQQFNVNVSRYTAALKNLKSACFSN